MRWAVYTEPLSWFTVHPDLTDYRTKLGRYRWKWLALARAWIYCRFHPYSAAFVAPDVPPARILQA